MDIPQLNLGAFDQPNEVADKRRVDAHFFTWMSLRTLQKAIPDF